jgi:hypothetical protein
MGNTIRIGPKNWAETTTALAAVLELGSHEGRAIARVELRRMADVADRVPEFHSALVDFHKWFIEFIGAETYAEIDCRELREIMRLINSVNGKP